MTVELFANLPSTTVSSGGTTAPSPGTVQTWTVASSAGFPAASSGASPPTQFHIADPADDTEIIAVTNISGTAWTVTRGAEGSAPVAHSAGFAVSQVVSAGAYGGFAQLLPAANTWTGSQYFKSGSPWYDARAFGATGNGVADDTTAIQAAITAAAGGICYLPPGTYAISAGLRFGTSQVRLTGAGRGKTTIRALGTFSGFGLFYDFTSGLSGCTVEEITFDSDALANVSAIQFGTCANMSVRRCEFTNKTGQGWAVAIGNIIDDGTHGTSSASTNVVFTDNWVHDNGTGTNETVLAVNCRFSRFDSNYFYNNTNSAYSLNLYGYCNSSSACGNIFNSTQSAIFILASVGVVVNDNNIQSSTVSQTGIAVCDSAQVTVNSNAIQSFTSGGSGGTGITLFSYGGNFDGHPSVYTGNYYVTIEGNAISQGYYGISIGVLSSEPAYNTEISVIGNIIANTVWCSLIIGRNDPSAAITAYVSDNRMIGTAIFGGYGVVSVFGYNSNVALTNVTFRNNKVYPTTAGSPGTACGILIRAATSLLADNDVTGTGVSLPAISADTGAVITTRNNPGYNPVGAVTVAVPATTVATAALTQDAVFYITAASGGSTLAVISGGPSVVVPASAVVPVRVPAGQTLTPAYGTGNAPTWVVEGE